MSPTCSNYPRMVMQPQNILLVKDSTIKLRVGICLFWSSVINDCDLQRIMHQPMNFAILQMAGASNITCSGFYPSKLSDKGLGRSHWLNLQFPRDGQQCITLTTSYEWASTLTPRLDSLSHFNVKILTLPNDSVLIKYVLFVFLLKNKKQQSSTMQN